MPLFARKPENINTSMSAAPKLALVPAGRYYCDVNWSYHNVSTGLDNIGPRILKMSANIIAPSILFIVNKSITSGKFPSVWKEAKVKPLFKAGSKEDVNNYRPISILPTLSKLIEKWVESQFSIFFK